MGAKRKKETSKQTARETFFFLLLDSDPILVLYSYSAVILRFSKSVFILENFCRNIYQKFKFEVVYKHSPNNVSYWGGRIT